MKLWDSMTTCLMLLSSVRAGPLPRSQQPLASAKRRGRGGETPPEPPRLQGRLAATAPGEEPAGGPGEVLLGEGGRYKADELEDVMDFIKVTIGRIRRSASLTISSSTSDSPSTSRSPGNLNGRAQHRRGRKSQERRRGGEPKQKVRRRGQAQGCVLKQIRLNVSELGLGYRSGEEMIFRYCSGPCRKAETNYDKILYNLARGRRFPPKDAPPQACCRPIAFDDDLSFLDDNLVYHTVRKHSAKRCGCV